MDLTEGFQCLGHSNWTICTLLSQFYFPNFTTFSLSCWEANSYYPRGLIMRKGNSPNSRSGLDRGVPVPGAFKLDHLQPVKQILSRSIFAMPPIINHFLLLQDSIGHGGPNLKVSLLKRLNFRQIMFSGKPQEIQLLPLPQPGSINVNKNQCPTTRYAM